MTCHVTVTQPGCQDASLSEPTGAQNAMAQVVHPVQAPTTQPEPDMSASLTSAAAAHVRALRRAGLGVSARQAAFDARRAIGAVQLRACVA